VLAAQLAGPERAREATAAIFGVALLGIDPGEALCEACLRMALADGGADEQLLCKVAWSLAVLQVGGACSPASLLPCFLVLYSFPASSQTTGGGVHCTDKMVVYCSTDGSPGSLPLLAPLLRAPGASHWGRLAPRPPMDLGCLEDANTTV
jgi:hypothetical protein